MTTFALPEGPTLNPTYNDLLVRWAKECVCLGAARAACACGAKAGTRVCLPECEECCADLTGKHVFEKRSAWVGECCTFEAASLDITDESRFDWRDEYPEPTSTRWGRGDREDFHADG